MSKTKLLIGAVAILLLLNIALIAALIIGRPGGHRGGPPRSNEQPGMMIINRLNFDDQQAKAFELLIKDHQMQMQEKEVQIRDLKGDLYAQLKEDTGTTDSLIQELGKIQTEIEGIHFQHFSEVKGLCREDQLPAFNKLTENLGKILGRRPPPKKRGRK